MQRRARGDRFAKSASLESCSCSCCSCCPELHQNALIAACAAQVVNCKLNFAVCSAAHLLQCIFIGAASQSCAKWKMRSQPANPEDMDARTKMQEVKVVQTNKVAAKILLRGSLAV